MHNIKLFITSPKKDLIVICFLLLFSSYAHSERVLFRFQDYSEFRYRLFLIAHEANKKLWLATDFFYDEAFAVEMVMRKKQGVDVRLVITDEKNMDDFRDKALCKFLLRNTVVVTYGHKESQENTLILADKTLFKINLDVESNTLFENKLDFIVSDLHEFNSTKEWFMNAERLKIRESQQNISTTSSDFLRPYDYTHDTQKISRSNALTLPKKLKWKKEE